MAPKRMNVLVYSGLNPFDYALGLISNCLQVPVARSTPFVTVSTPFAVFCPQIMQLSPLMEMQFSKNPGRLRALCLLCQEALI